MSDMSRSAPRLPAAPDHELHDALLVAQFVAGDPLKPEQQTQAQRLVSTCGACAALAADLPAVSRAVAQEPVPPRRRDFRLDPETARELRGNAITRYLRGLSLPSSRAFQPAAAGVLSVGLLFLVAGYAWPDGGTVTVQAEPNFVDWRPGSSGAALEAQPAPVVVAEPDADDGVAAPEAALELQAGDGDALVGAERAMEDEDFADSLAESQAGLAAEPLRKSQRTDDGAAVDVAEAAAKASEAAAQAPEAARTETYADQVGPEIVEPPEVAEPRAATSGAQGLPADESGEALAQRVQDVAADAADALALEETETAGATTVAAAAPGDGGPEDVLIVLGLALALGGGGLLLLGWLARRARDPLAP